MKAHHGVGGSLRINLSKFLHPHSAPDTLNVVCLKSELKTLFFPPSTQHQIHSETQSIYLLRKKKWKMELCTIHTEYFFRIINMKIRSTFLISQEKAKIINEHNIDKNPTSFLHFYSGDEFKDSSFQRSHFNSQPLRIVSSDHPQCS